MYSLFKIATCGLVVIGLHREEAAFTEVDWNIFVLFGGRWVGCFGEVATFTVNLLDKF